MDDKKNVSVSISFSGAVDEAGVDAVKAAGAELETKLKELGLAGSVNVYVSEPAPQPVAEAAAETQA